MFRAVMNKLGFYDTRRTRGLYVAQDGKAMVGTYVDDCLIAAETPELVEKIQAMIGKEFSIKTTATMEGDMFKADVLGLDVCFDRKRGSVKLSLETYIKGMIEKHYQDLVTKAFPFLQKHAR